MSLEKNSNDYQFPLPANPTPVADFYKGKNILITGATGFMGKVLIEKLLWACEDIGNIYLLMRPKKDHHPNERLLELISLPIFERLKKRNPKCLNKLKPISADMSVKNLGISLKDREELESSVSIIFHVASSVRFKDPIKKAVLLNVRGTEDIINLAKNMKKLKVLIYVSTTYSNCERTNIEEKIFPSGMNWKNVINIAETCDEHMLNILTPKLLEKKPNTYILTKFLAENAIYDSAATLPTIILRPSIVAYCIKEPIPGWMDSMNGPAGLAAAIYSGVLHVIYGDTKCLPNYVPCDYSINGIILAAWYRGITNTKDCLIMNGAGHSKDYSFEFLMECVENSPNIEPLNRMLWFPTFTTTKYKCIYYFILIFTQLLPGIFFDVIFRLRGINFSLMRLYRQLFVANDALYHFLCNQWDISIENYKSMINILTPEDKKTFPYILEDGNNIEIIRIGSIGLKKYIFKDDTSEAAIKTAKMKFKRMFWVHRITKFCFISLVLWILMKATFKYIVPVMITHLL